jgi:hypothetical protein
MSAARDLFGSVPRILTPGANDNHEKLCRAAELWRSDGQHFSAGVCMLDACHAAWGDPDRMIKAAQTGVADLERVIAEESQTSPASIAALYKLRQAVSMVAQYFDVDKASASVRIRELAAELAQRLYLNFKVDDHADNYLVRGLVLVADRDGGWQAIFPDYEVPLGTEQPGVERLQLNIPSAFHLFIANREWQPAYEITQCRSAAFTTAGLKGWRSVTIANMNPAERVGRFDEAADAFAADVQPDDTELQTSGGHWSSANKDLWARYFRARARLTESIQHPENVRTLLEQAGHALVGTEAGWHSGEVSKFQVIVNVLSQMVSDPSTISEEKARHQFEQEIRISGKAEHDESALTFISEAAKHFAGFARDPSSELTRGRLGTALQALERIPSIGSDVVEALRPEIGKKAFDTILGPYRTWMHRALESITDEAQLRRILLRLLQSALPRYAQIRHGPLEYGKDVVVLVSAGGENVLRLYQVKCGDIEMKKWRESKHELEEMFQVPLPSLQLPVQPDRIEGVLVTNGHAKTFTELAMEGWLKEQRDTHGRSIKFIHLDALVDWIATEALINELRVALKDENVDVPSA